MNYPLEWFGVPNFLEKEKPHPVQLSAVFSMAETVGFEPTCRLITDKTISSRSRYDHFDTSPSMHPDKGRFLQILEFPLEQGPS